MRFTLISDDKIVIKDGEPFNFTSSIPSVIHAIQWYGDKGEIEYNNGDSNKKITKLSDIQEFIDLFDKEKQKKDSKPVVTVWEKAEWDEKENKWSVKNDPDFINLKKAHDKEVINKSRAVALRDGFKYTFPDKKKGTVKIEDASIMLHIIGLATAANSFLIQNDTTTTLVFRDYENINHEMNAVEIVTFSISFLNWYLQVYKDSWAEKDKL